MVKQSTAIALGVAAAAGIAGVAAAVLLGGGGGGGGVLTANPSSAPVGQPVQFVITGGVSPTSTTWAFGDGLSDTTGAGVITDTHTYSIAGTFNVTAVYVDQTGTVSVSTTVTITPVSPMDVNTAVTEMNSPTSGQVNQTITVSGTLTRTDTGAGLLNEQVIIESSQNLVTWTPVITVTTGLNGSYSGGIIFLAAGTYYTRGRFAGGPVV